MFAAATKFLGSHWPVIVQYAARVWDTYRSAAFLLKWAELLGCTIPAFNALIAGFAFISAGALAIFPHFIHMRRSKLSAKCATGNEAFLLWHLMARFVWNVAGFESRVAFQFSLWLMLSTLWVYLDEESWLFGWTVKGCNMLRCCCLDALFLGFGQEISYPPILRQTNVRQQLGSYRKLRNPHMFHHQ